MPPVRYHDGKFPPRNLDWPRLIPLLGPAAAAVARYDGLLGAIPSPDVLLSPLSTQEAVLSSRIEGTQATMGEVLEYEAGHEAASPERREDIREVLNYRPAMREAEKMLESLPLSQRVIRKAHEILLSGVRGACKSPGEYRRVPNWIGPPNTSINEARFIPIAAERLPDAMGAWERYAHAEAPDRLVQLAILHAEFEALHPFLDGNGRLGRMLVPLFMWQAGLIQRPMFYISAYFEARRDAYYDALLAVSRDDDWTGWCHFFLEAVRVQAEDNLQKARAIHDLYQELKRRVAELTRSQYAIHALDWIFERPVFKSSDFVASAGIPPATARRVLRVLSDEGVLTPVDAPPGASPRLLCVPRASEPRGGEDGLLTITNARQDPLPLIYRGKMIDKARSQARLGRPARGTGRPEGSLLPITRARRRPLPSTGTPMVTGKTPGTLAGGFPGRER